MPGPSFCDPASAIDQGTEEPRSRSLLVVGIQHHKHPLGLRLSAVTFQRQFYSSKRAISRCTGKNNYQGNKSVMFQKGFHLLSDKFSIFIFHNELIYVSLFSNSTTDV